MLSLVGVSRMKLEGVLAANTRGAPADKLAQMTTAAGIPAAASLWSHWEEHIAQQVVFANPGRHFNLTPAASGVPEESKCGR